VLGRAADAVDELLGRGRGADLVETVIKAAGNAQSRA
jgi:hypothetical protein